MIEETVYYAKILGYSNVYIPKELRGIVKVVAENGKIVIKKV